MDLEKPTTLWEYRRKKQRILSPVTRGLIFGSMFLGWMLYCSIYTHISDINEVETLQDKVQREMLRLYTSIKLRCYDNDRKDLIKRLN